LQILTTPATLFFITPVRVYPFITKPQATFFIEEHLQGPGARVEYPLSQNMLLFISELHGKHLLW
jgi:hypothetical protein